MVAVTHVAVVAALLALSTTAAPTAGASCIDPTGTCDPNSEVQHTRSEKLP
jgi:hypothetical protein